MNWSELGARHNFLSASIRQHMIYYSCPVNAMLTCHFTQSRMKRRGV